MHRSLLALLLLLLGCSGDDKANNAADAAPADTGPKVVPQGNAEWEKPGTFTVGHAIFPAKNGDRALTVQLWYPSRAASPGTPIEDLVVDAADRATMVKLMEGSKCVRRKMSSTRDLAPAEGTFPLIAYSHCHSCSRFSSAAIAERLASHGYAVIAPDHTGNTVFDAQRGTVAPLNGEFLATRAADIKAVLDEALNATSTVLPAALLGKFDANKVAMFGHSYGAATTGLVLARDARLKAGVAIAAPMENDLLPPAKMAEIKVPAMFLLAREDNSISEIGNNIIRSNFKKGNPPLFLLEVEDAGHWSFSDIAALTPNLAPGCGSGTRQTEPGVDFQYLEIESARALAASFVTAFFLAHLGGNAAAKGFLTTKHPSGVVAASAR